MSLTKWQLEAIPYAAEKGREYVEATPSPKNSKEDHHNDWLCVVEIICLAYEEKMRQLRNDGEPPF